MKYNNNIRFRIISSLMILMLMLSFISPFVGQGLVYAEENEETEDFEIVEEIEEHALENEDQLGGYVPNYGEIPDPSKVYKAEGHEALDLPFNIVDFPSNYDLRTENKLTPVKNQGGDGNCWAFACYGSLESYLMSEREWDFSENHMKNTHGFDVPVNEGGNRSMATAYLARGGGPVSEENDPYEEGSYWSNPNLPIEKIIKEVLYIPDRDEGSPFDNDRIKWAVMEYGGVHTSIRFEGNYHNFNTDSYYCYYDNGQRKSNHGVVIVGWDDNYPADKFSVSPPGDGAFIVRNSWGPDWGEGGYFYVSYYDKIIGINNTVYINAVEPNEYNNIYQYDELGWTGHNRGYNREIAWGANVFECRDENETLDAVSFYTNTEGTQYEIYINSNYNLDNNFVNGGQKVAEGTIDMPGYHTIDLDMAIPLTKGNEFSVAVKFKTPGYGYPIPLEVAEDDYSSKASSYPGESFISYDGQGWKDLGYDGNVCIKAFTKIDNIVEEEEHDLIYIIPKDGGMLSEYDINIHYRDYSYSDNTKYYYAMIPLQNEHVTIEENEDNWILKLDDLPLDSKKLYIGISTGKTAYVKIVDSNNIGDVEILDSTDHAKISIDKEELYQTQTINIKDYKIDTSANISDNLPELNNIYEGENIDRAPYFDINLYLYFLDENDAGFLVGHVGNDGKIPKGQYDIKLETEEKGKVYNLIYKDIYINGDNILPIYKDKLLKVSLDLDAFNSNNPSDIYMRQIIRDSSTIHMFNRIWNMGKTIPNVYVYDYDGWLNFDVIYDGNVLHYEIQDNLKGLKNLNVKLSPKIKAHINFNRNIYYTGEYIYNLRNAFQLKDEYGNYFSFFDKDNIIRIKKNGQVVAQYDPYRVNQIKLPKEVGIYTIEYLVEDFLLVEPSSITIQISKDGPIETTFKDPNLERMIRERIGKPIGQLYKSDVEGIRELWIGEENIINLEGIQNLKGLEHLWINSNKIIDFLPLQELNNLELLQIYNCGMDDEDMEFLSKMTSLRRLYLERNNIKNIISIGNLIELTDLGLYDNQIENILSIGNLTKLEFLNLNNNYLNLSDNTTMTIINRLKQQGAEVYYEDQNTIVENPDLTYIIPKDGGYFSKYDIDIYYKNYHGGRKDQYSYRWVQRDKYNIDIQSNANNWIIKIGDMSWEDIDEYSIGISTGESLYIQNPKKEDKGKEISLNRHSHVGVNLNSKDLPQEQNIYFYYIDENNRKFYAGSVENGGFIPKGDYDFNVEAKDNNKIYDLIYSDWDISEDMEIPVFEDNLIKINLNLEDFALENINQIYAGQGIKNSLINYRYSRIYDNERDNSIPDLYFYDHDGWLNFEIQYDDYSINYETQKDLSGLKDLDVKISPEIKTHINLNRNIYYPGEYINNLWDVFRLKDEYGNHCSMYEGENIIRIKKDGETLNSYNLDYIENIELPSEIGDYTIEYLISNFPLVEPTKFEIQIVADELIEIPFADQNLEKAIRNIIGKLEGQIYKRDVLPIDYISVSNRDITSLEGIQNFENLGFLEISYNEIKDLSPLMALDKLDALIIANNKLDNEVIKVLENITTLQGLNLDGNNISNISPIGKLTNLNYLSLSDNSIENIEPINNLTKLRFLNLENNLIENIYPIYSSWENGGFKAGSEINLNRNYLDLTDWNTMMYIEELENNNVNIKHKEQKISLSSLPGGGHTIILGDMAYEKDYLMDNISILIRELIKRKPMIIKLSKDIYIDQDGYVIDKDNIPEIIGFEGFSNINETRNVENMNIDKSGYKKGTEEEKFDVLVNQALMEYEKNKENPNFSLIEFIKKFQ